MNRRIPAMTHRERMQRLLNLLRYREDLDVGIPYELRRLADIRGDQISQAVTMVEELLEDVELDEIRALDGTEAPILSHGRDNREDVTNG